MGPSPFVGNGWAFPPAAALTGGVALVSGHQEIDQAVRLVLGTVPGERPMRPEFGCRMWDRVFDPADETTAVALGQDVREALERWEPRIDVERVSVTVPSLPATLRVEVEYAIRSTNDRRNLVFPFYVIPAGGELPVPTHVLTSGRT